MTAAPPDGERCDCCGGSPMLAEPTLTSLFLSRRAWGGLPEATELLTCPQCGFRTFRRQLSAEEAARYYEDYGSDDHVRERGRDEIFYTRRAHDANEAWQDSPPRQAAVRERLESLGVPLAQCACVDVGGGDGRLVASLPVARRAVFDLARVPAVPGVERLDDEAALHARPWDLVLCAQTLEHISRPRLFLHGLVPSVRPGGWLYLELPHQPWRDWAGPASLRRGVLRLALRRRRLHQWLDLYSTGFRVKFGVLPPLGFVPMREHVNFFGVPALQALSRSLGWALLHADLHPIGVLQAVLQRPPAVATSG